MISRVYEKDNVDLKKQLLGLINESGHVSFCDFIVSKMLDVSTEQKFTKDDKRVAYHIFIEKIKDEYPASIPTMKRWFGVLEFSKPKREHILKIGFALNLTVSEVNEYLLVGNQEPELQVNDYREWVYMYGYENHKTYEECEKMISAFSHQLNLQHKLQQRSNTNNLKRYFDEIKNVDETMYVSWMIDHAELFKGYSATALHYFEKYKHQVFLCVKKDANNQLNELLAQTDYYTWKKTQVLSTKSEHDKILQFVKQARRRKTRRYPDEVMDGIVELSRIAYLEKESDRFLLSVVYAPEVNAAKQYSFKKQPLYNMTIKHLSDLMNIARHKNCELQLLLIQVALEHYNPEDLCPKEIVNFGLEQFQQSWEQSCVKDVLDWVLYKQKEGKRRQIVVSREDLLPLILYVSQHKYTEFCEQDNSEYNQKIAKQQFIDAANAVLNACCMTQINEEYLLDHLMMLCFQENEMYSYSDILESIYK